MAIVAHPDDESLGCGGTLAKHSKAGDVVMVLAMTDGVGSRYAAGGAAAVAVRREQAMGAFGILGVSQSGFSDWPDNRMDGQPLLNVVIEIEEAMSIFKPTIVYTHHGADLNVDHRVVHDAVRVACRPQPSSTVGMLLLFEVPCSSAWGDGFTPNYFSDISDTLSVKLKALECYAHEMRPFPHPRSLVGVSNLAALRGAAVGIPAAEAFVAARIVC